MNQRNLRPAQTPNRTVAPFHRGPSAQPAAVQSAGSGAGYGAMVNAPNAALLIDFDNVTMGIRSELLQAELKNLLSSDVIKGKVSVRRAYADWRRYPSYVVPLTESSIDLIFAPAYGTAKKNASDIRLAIDALELVFTRPDVGTFVLLSGDSDFSSMVIKLKEYGKYVIGVGIRESASDLLVMNCDEYYSYNALAGLVKTGEDESTRWDPFELVTEAITRMKRNGDVMRSDRLKQVMQEIDSSFNEKDLGKSKFSQFVQDAAQRGLVRTTKLENGQLEVDVPLTDGASPAAAHEARAADSDGTAEAAHGERAERDDRRGRRGRRGRGNPREREARDDDDAPRTEVTDEFATVELATPIAPPMAQAPAARPVSPIAQFKPSFTPSTSAPVAAVTPTPVTAAPVAPAAPSISFGDPANDDIGRGGERLTRVEAFDLVRRSVEALVQGEETTTASVVRQRAYEILGRDSESLSGRNFERILRDSHDADMIDLRRRGNDFEVARAADAAPIVEQLKEAEQVHKAQVAANAPPPAPRGMAHRGVGNRNKGGRAGAPGISADMLMVGVVGTPKVAPAPSVPAATTVPTAPALARESPAANEVQQAPPAPASPTNVRETATALPTKAKVAVAAPASNEMQTSRPAEKPVAKKGVKPAAKKPATPPEDAPEEKAVAKKTGAVKVAAPSKPAATPRPAAKKAAKVAAR